MMNLETIKSKFRDLNDIQKLGIAIVTSISIILLTLFSSRRTKKFQYEIFDFAPEGSKGNSIKGELRTFSYYWFYSSSLKQECVKEVLNQEKFKNQDMLRRVNWACTDFFSKAGADDTLNIYLNRIEPTNDNESSTPVISSNNVSKSKTVQSNNKDTIYNSADKVLVDITAVDKSTLIQSNLINDNKVYLEADKEGKIPCILYNLKSRKTFADLIYSIDKAYEKYTCQKQFMQIEDKQQSMKVYAQSLNTDGFLVNLEVEYLTLSDIDLTAFKNNCRDNPIWIDLNNALDNSQANLVPLDPSQVTQFRTGVYEITITVECKYFNYLLNPQ